MTTETRSQNPDRYQWGRAALLRARRDYFGLGKGEMAERLGMSERSYQRIEAGEAAIPPGLWDSVARVQTEFTAEVRNRVELAMVVGPSLSADREESAWQRAVIAHAVAYESSIVPMFEDDYTNEKENAYEAPR